MKYKTFKNIDINMYGDYVDMSTIQHISNELNVFDYMLLDSTEQLLSKINVNPFYVKNNKFWLHKSLVIDFALHIDLYFAVRLVEKFGKEIYRKRWLSAEGKGELWKRIKAGKDLLQKRNELVHFENCISNYADTVILEKEKVEIQNNLLRDMLYRRMEYKVPVRWWDWWLCDRVSYYKTYETDENYYELTDLDNICCKAVWCEMLEQERSTYTTGKGKMISDWLIQSGKWRRTELHRNFPLYGRQRLFKRNIF